MCCWFPSFSGHQHDPREAGGVCLGKGWLNGDLLGELGLCCLFFGDNQQPRQYFCTRGGSSHAFTPLLIQCQPCPEAPLPVAFKAGCPREDYRSRHAASPPAPGAALAGRVLHAGRQGGMLQQDGRQARPGGGRGLSSGSPAADHTPREKRPGAPCAAPPGEGQGRPKGDPSLPQREGMGTGGSGWGPVSPHRGRTRSGGHQGGEEGCPRLAQERAVRALGKRGLEKGLWGADPRGHRPKRVLCPLCLRTPSAGRMRGGRGERPQPSAHTLRGFLGIGGRAAGSQIP